MVVFDYITMIPEDLKDLRLRNEPLFFLPTVTLSLEIHHRELAYNDQRIATIRKQSLWN